MCWRKERGRPAEPRGALPCVVVAELLQQPRRAFDIGEEEGDGTARKLARLSGRCPRSIDMHMLLRIG
jgi:hypothetical protein